jgi:hypothetical protein
MAGIGAAAQPQPGGREQPGQMQEPGPSAQDDAGETQPNVTPEEQAAYDQFVTNGMKLIYQGDHVAPAVLDQLEGKWDDVKPSARRDPAGRAAARPGQADRQPRGGDGRAGAGARGERGQRPAEAGPGVVFHGGAELLEQLAEIAQAANIHDFSEDE